MEEKREEKVTVWGGGGGQGECWGGLGGGDNGIRRTGQGEGLERGTARQVQLGSR